MRKQGKGYKTYKAYPPDWLDVIVPSMLAKANNRCQVCGKLNGEILPDGKKVVLTVAHLDHDVSNWNIDFTRLQVKCQKDHLNYDRERNWMKRKIRWKPPTH